MKNSDKLDEMLKDALAPAAPPSEILNQQIINKLNEKGNEIMKPVIKRRLSTVFIAAALIVLMSSTVFAAWQLLGSRDVAQHLGDQRLAKAFEDKSAIEINRTIKSGGYSFTLLGVVSGRGLSDFEADTQKIHPDRTYAVMSIAKEDGSKMPDTKDENYGETPFFVSPLVKGLKPWQYNAASMNGGYNDLVVDGIMYRMVECDGVEMFADRGLYLCASTTNFYDPNAYNYDEKTGVISPKSDFKGANALFNLPLDVKKAATEKAAKYVIEMEKEQAPQADAEGDAAREAMEQKLATGVVIPESVKVLTVDKDGMVEYKYNDLEIKNPVDALFAQGQTGLSDFISMDDTTAIQFTRDEKGVIKGMILKLK